MAKKRASEESEESDTQAKKTKVTDPEFNGTVFKSMLKDPTKAMKGLETFVSVAKKLPCPDLYDVVEGYIKISMECADIFKLLEGEKHTETELMLIFQSLEMILLRTASDLSHFGVVGSTIVKKTTTSHMKLLLSSLHSENHRFVRLCLGLLSAMTSQGPDMAREVFAHFHFSKGLCGLARRRDKMGRPDVRMAYIQFALSFLVSGDSVTIGQVLEMKDFLTDILSNGLKEDRISIVNLILSTLQTKVVQNKAISKTQKVRFFSPAVLAQFATLYKWNGIVDVSSDDGKMAESVTEEEGRALVRELVHKFLLDLCCSRKHGISFHDPSLGTAGRAGNIVLLQFLVGLKQATEDVLVADLLVNVLKGNPDMLPRYFKETQYSFTPRLKSAWQENVALLKKIYEAQPEVSPAFQTRVFVPLPRLLTMVMVTSLPPACNKAFFTQGLNMANTVVQHTTLSVLSFILRRAQKNMEHCLDKSTWQNSDFYTSTMMEDLVQQYREALGKILPDVNSIVCNWQSLTRKGKGEDAGKKMVKGGVVPDKPPDVQEHGSDDLETTLRKALILRVLCLYQRVVPHLICQSRFDFSKLLKGIVTEKGMREEVPPVLQYQILQLALDLPASKFSWFRVQDISDSGVTGGEKSVFYLLLQMFVGSSSSSHLRSSTRMLVLKVLKDSGVFEHTWRELDLWLDQLAHVTPSQQEVVILFLERALKKLVSDPYTYTEKAASLVQEAAYLQANLCGQEGDAVSIPISHIDDVLDMVDVIFESGEGEEAEELGSSLSDDLIVQTFPYSALVPAALEARNNLTATLKEENGVVFTYLAAVLSDILHSQRDPLPLCLALQQYDKELDSSEGSGSPHPSAVEFHRYYSRWLPQLPREELFKSSEFPVPDGEDPDVSFGSLMKTAYSQGPSGLLQDSFKLSLEKALSTLRVSEFPVAAKQVLLYIKTSVDNFGAFHKDQGLAVLATLMEVLRALVETLRSSEEQEEQEEPVVVDSQEGSDLFLEVNTAPRSKADKDQVLLTVLSSIFKHSTLEQWFLALQLGTLPSHSLRPHRVKRLCGRLTEGVLALLRSAAPALRDLGSLELVAGYLDALGKGALKELSAGEEGSSGGRRESPGPAVEGLLVVGDLAGEALLGEVASAALLLPPEQLATGGELSAYGQAALRLLSGGGALALTSAHLRGLAALLVSCPSSTQVEELLLQALRTEPPATMLVPGEVLLHCLQRAGSGPASIGSLLLLGCAAHRLQLELWCLEPACLVRVAEALEDFLPLLQAYLKAASAEDWARPKLVKTAALKAMKEALLPGLSCSVLSADTVGDSLARRVETLSGLVRLAAPTVEDMAELVDGLPALLERADCRERWQLVDPISDKLADSPERLTSWKKALLTSALRWLNAAYKCNKEQEAAAAEGEEGVLQRLQGLLTSAEDVSASEWNGFVKTGLKYRYRDRAFLDTLNVLLERLCDGEGGPAHLLALPAVHMMTTSHSLFLPSMLGAEDEPGGGPASKEALVSLLLTLVKKCPSVCQSGHFGVLLGAYGATLSPADQKILLLLQEYERNNLSLAESQCLLWGGAAVEHHKACRSLGRSLWQQPSSEDLLALLSPDRMLETTARFPQHRRIIPQEGKELIYKEEGARDLGALYDPCFLLPLFSIILKPESVIDCYKFVSSHALGLTVVALSSYDPKLRAAAYQVLGSFCRHLEAARFREKRQLLYLMETVKNGIRQQNLRLPFLLVTYVAQVAQQMLKPEEHMYLVLNRFLLAHQYLDLKRVPEFFKLFYSFDFEHKVERDWILGVLKQGVADRHCYELCDQQGVFQVLLSFCSTPLCDQSTQALIVEVLHRAAHITKAAYELIKVHGLLTWVLQLADRKFLESRLLWGVVDMLHTLWFTNLGKKENRQVDDAPPTGSIKCLPVPLINEFLCVLAAFVRHLRTGVRVPQLVRFLRTLSSVLKHRGTALGLLRQAGWVAVQEQAVSGIAALELLHCWGLLSGDALLLSDLQGVLERHRVKNVTRVLKEKGRGKGSSLRGRGLEGDEDEGEQGQDAEGGVTMTEGEPLLRDVFTHTEFPPPPPSSQDGDSDSGSSLPVQTAQLLVRWTLRSLVAGPRDPAGLLSYLRWFHARVLPHRAAVGALLADAEVKRNFLRLYHRTCSPGSSATGTLQLFTDVMLRLLEALGLPEGNLHQTLLSACLSAVQEGEAGKEEAGPLLLSLYIHELWSGATEPGLLLAHVGRVREAELRDRKRKAKRRATETQDPVTRICQDIWSAVGSSALGHELASSDQA